MGISYNEFWSLTPRTLKVIVEGYKLRRKVVDEEHWFLGHYVFDAVSLALGNAFRKKTEKAKSYFEVVDKPITQQIKDENGAPVDEEDAKKQTEMFFKSLEIMAANHRLTKGSKVS